MAAAIEPIKILCRKQKAEHEFVNHQFTVMEQNIKRRYLRQVECETEVAMGTALSTIALVKCYASECKPNEPRGSNWSTKGDQQSFKKKRFRVTRNN